MTKREAVNKLKEMGFDAYSNSGILMVYGTDDLKKVKKAVKEIDYTGSYGCANRERKDHE